MDRTKGQMGACGVGDGPKVAAMGLHPWEEPPLSGTRGSGTIFFTGCTLSCVFCQNYPISQLGVGREMGVEDLADGMIDLQKKGAHNLNLVTATHQVAAVVEALVIAAERGLRLPVVYNTSGYEHLETLKLLDGIIDIYLPDIKYADPQVARMCSGKADYVVHNRAALQEMWRQVGPLRVDERGVAVKGMLVRHLVLPDDLSGTTESLRFLSDEIGPQVWVSLMSQYFPAHLAPMRPPLDRKTTEEEYARACSILDRFGLENGFVQSSREDSQQLVEQPDMNIHYEGEGSMKEFERLTSRIVDRVNVNLRKPAFDVGPHLFGVVPAEQFARFYASYGLSLHHPVHIQFNHSALAGSYFLGRCSVDHSVLYKTDVRGDELKTKSDRMISDGVKIPLHEDETIRIKDSWLIKNLIHSNSHDPESPEEFLVKNTVSMHYANIHGSLLEGCFIGPCATVDLTTLRNCVVGAYAYVQTGELAHREVEAGRVWIQAGDKFEFTYQYPPDVLKRYVRPVPGKRPEGELVDFVESRKQDFEHAFEIVGSRSEIPVPSGASLSRYAVVKGKTVIGDNVLVAQRAYLEDATLGKGANVQENCYIVHSRLDGLNVTAHGGKIVHAHMGKKIFVGFNSLLRGSPRCELAVGDECIIMPHTIIDLEEAVEVPPRHLVWGHVRNMRDLREHSISLDKLSRTTGTVELGAMRFEGSGAECVTALQHRIEHILEENGAYFEEGAKRGHAQRTRNISFNIIQPHPEGPLKGIYPFMEIRQ